MKEPTLSPEIEKFKEWFNMWLDHYQTAELTEVQTMEDDLIKKFAIELAKVEQRVRDEEREQGLKDALVLAYDLADKSGSLDYGKLHRKVELALTPPTTNERNL